MHEIARWRVACSVLFLFSGIDSTSGAERPVWADPHLPVADGLVVWLDAAAQPAAASQQDDEEQPSDDAREHWLDSSGHGRDLHQPTPKARPALRRDGDMAAIRFDGRGAHFLRENLGVALNEATVFLVAAPASNEGGFRGLLSLHAEGEDDFLSGLNVDQGAFASPSFQVVNVEGAGFAGMRNLRTDDSPFGQWRRICVSIAASGADGDGVALFVDGQAEASRPRERAMMKLDELIVGARSYGGTNEPRGFFQGEVAEVIIFDRALSNDERAAVDEYLAAKYRDAGPIPPPSDAPEAGSIRRVASPPPLQMFVPGFSVRELPVELTNINNVLYRDDGVLVALAYDGNVYLLTDSDGDGLEDRWTVFWESRGELRAPIGMALTPPGYEYGQGVAVAAKGKCVLLLDRDGDDRADEELVIADGWKELAHGVDALGIAFDPRDHAVHFGLGVENFTDAYLLGSGQESKFHLDSERGTILRVAPDLASREIVATGIRFPVAIRFNAAGDLFCTDQEGATWLANGNPFDELLHVQRGRHYGFPPRHPRHLPHVIDEPSVFDYRPQHQSTCGLNFNEPAADGTIFGPAWWKSDALVAGYSRGKLFRTKLARTPSGYVAQTQVLAALSMLTADACVAPDRSLVAATHSGLPDWGSGASGTGKLYKVAFTDADAAVPSVVWAENPREVRIAFDRPVDAETLKGLASRAAIDGGEAVAAGDRFENLRPPYALVEHQQNAPRFPVEVQGVQLTPDRRTLILTTAPHVASMTYAVALPSVRKGRRDGDLEQLPDIDLQYDLCGIEARWQPNAGDGPWQGWLPHLDLDASRAFTAASAHHDPFWENFKAPGTLLLRTSLNLRNMLHPAVQPGSTIDHQWPQEQVTLTFTSNCPVELTLDGESTAATRSGGAWTIERTIAVDGDENLPLELRLSSESSGDSPTLTVHYHTSEDARPRPLALRRFLLPWARGVAEAPTMVDNREIPELQGGSWLRGQREFFGAEAGCSKCHATRGQGAAIGPDLSNLPKRDYASVLRDISQPSAAINPDHLTQIVVTTDGLVKTGTVRTDGDRLIISDAEGKESIVARDDVEQMQPSELSIMPEGIPKLLGPKRLRDLLTFLLVEPPHMPVYGELSPPPPRSSEEVQAVLNNAETTTLTRPLHIVLVTGPKDHGPGEHDYPAWQGVWKSLLEMADNVRVTTANSWPTADDLKSADAMVFYQQGSWTPERARDIDRFLRRGGGLVYIHYAVDGGGDPAGFADRLGLAWQGLRSKFRHGPLEIDFTGSSNHPIARNFNRVRFVDESYWNLVGDPQRVNLLATGVEEGQPQPLFWTLEPEAGGRVFVSIPGHFSWTFDDPLFRILLLRGIAWTMREPVDCFNELVLPGARVNFANQ